MASLPLVLIAVLLLWVTRREWSAAPLVARVALGCSTLMICVVAGFPGQSAASVVEHPKNGLAWLFLVGRPIALACIFFSIAMLVREELEERA